MYQSNYKKTYGAYSQQNNQFYQNPTRYAPPQQQQRSVSSGSVASMQQNMVPPPVPATPIPPVVPTSVVERRNSNQVNVLPSPQRKPKSVFFTNSFSVAGRICERGLQLYNNKVARFVIAFNGHRDENQEPLYTDCVMFAPKGGILPSGLFVKGKPVVATGFRRASTWVDQQGAKHYQIDHVVTQLQEILPDGSLK